MKQIYSFSPLKQKGRRGSEQLDNMVLRGSEEGETGGGEEHGESERFSGERNTGEQEKINIKERATKGLKINLVLENYSETQKDDPNYNPKQVERLP